jgi:hypothetical protein
MILAILAEAALRTFMLGALAAAKARRSRFPNDRVWGKK